MTLMQHEIDAIADRILDHVSGKLIQLVRSTIREELRMTDQAIVNLTSAVDGVVNELEIVVTTVQSEANALAAALAANGASNDPLIAAQTTRLLNATQAAATAIAALQTPPNSPEPSPAPSEAPVADPSTGASGATA